MSFCTNYIVATNVQESGGGLFFFLAGNWDMLKVLNGVPPDLPFHAWP